MTQSPKKSVTFLVWSLLAVSFFLFFLVKDWNEPATHIAYDTFLEDVEQQRVARISVDNNKVHVQLNDGSPGYVTLGVLDDTLSQRLSAQGAYITWGKPSRPWITALTIGLPLLLVLGFVVYFAKKAGSANTGMFSLGKSRARLVTDVRVTFEDVGGCEDAKAQLADVVDFLQNPRRWQAAGARLPRGILLEGPPGCGKTLLARAVAGATSANYYSVAASEFVELFVGVGAARVRDMFQTAAKNPPAVIFIDELDAVGRRRGSGLGLANDEREQTLNQLLVSLDGFEKDSSLVVIAATNRSDILDPALLRPGRFDRRIHVPLLSPTARREVLGIHTRQKPLAKDVRWDELVEVTRGFNGAQLESLANEAALLAVRRARQRGGHQIEITTDDFLKAIPPETCRSTLASLDDVLAESVTHLVRPRTPAAAHIRLQDDAEFIGEILWADAAFIKMRCQDGLEVLIPKRRIQSLYPRGETAAAAVPAIKIPVAAEHVANLA